MKVIVFGGSGFLGSHVCDALARDGHDVTVFDITPSQYLSDGQKMVVGDILDEDAVISAVGGHDAVYNFAGIADIDECVRRPLDTIRYNVLGNMSILEAARMAAVKRFVFASSVYVYSEHGYFYRSSKQACEHFIENYRKLYGMPYTILRYGSLYGSRSDERNSVYRMIKDAITKGEIISKGTGEELREFIHVEDAARLSVRILAPDFENEHVILTGTSPMKYREILEMIREMLGNRITVKCTGEHGADTHYMSTPYSFNPKIGKKLVTDRYLDMGQGLLGLIGEIYGEMHAEKREELGLLVDKDGEDKEGKSG